MLLHACLLDRVTPELVEAGLSVTEEPIGQELVATHLEDARSLGLLGEPGAEGSGARMHPLFREFLEHQFLLQTPPERVRAMHGAIARAAENTAWLTSAKHYALASLPEDAMRVLGSAASEALGTGAWGAAVEVVALMPDASPPPAVEVIKARALLSSGKEQAALSLLGRIDRAQLGPEERGLVGLTFATAFHLRGEGASLDQEVGAVAEDLSIPSPIHEIAVCWRQMLAANRGGSIKDVVYLLRDLAQSQLQRRLPYFAGITLHNLANAELARGNLTEAIRLASDAIDQLTQVDDASVVVASSQSIAAVATAESGRLAEGIRAAVSAASEPGATADAIAEAAYLNAVCGRTARAESLLAKFSRGDAPWSQELASRAQGGYARVALRLSEGDLSGARQEFESIAALQWSDVDTKSRVAVVDSMLSILEGADDALARAGQAVDTATHQNAWRWLARARILEAVAERDGDKLALWIAQAERESSLALLELADPIAASVGLLNPVPEALERSIIQAPARWVAALGRQLALSNSSAAGAAASLVARYGTLDDAPVLKAFDRHRSSRPHRRGYVNRLIRRVSPTVRVHDLGATSYEVGNRQVVVTETPRRSAALMLFLITYPRLMASKEQVMEGLWPEQSPKSAINSLHQTLFVLRRDIEPWYEDGATADYVRMESDMVYLDSEMFQVDSVAFYRQVSEILKSGRARDRGPEMLKLYQGKFAAEFEYEEWAESWRTQLHGAYLHLAQTTAQVLVREGLYTDAVDVLLPVVQVDPLALELRGTLVACLAALGSADAALAHYKSLAAAHVGELGVPAPAFREIVDSLGP